MRTSARFLLVVAVMLAVLVAVPTIASAAVFRSGDTVIVGPNERIDDDLYISGNNVQVMGTVTGDVVAAGQNVDIGGNIGNGVIAAGQTVRVTGDVGGTARLAAGFVTVTGRVAQDVVAAGSNVTLQSGSSVERDAVIGATTIVLDGGILRNLWVGGTTVNLNGPVGGDARIDAETLDMSADSSIKGNLTYSAAATNLNGTVSGQTVEQPRPERKANRQAAEGGGGFGALLFFGFLYWVRSLIGYVIFGLIAVLVFRRFTSDSTDALAEKPWPSLGWGALVLFAFPFAFVPTFILGILIGGWWIPVLALFAWFTLLAFGLIVGALGLGRLIVSRGEHKPHDVWPMLLGLLILWVAWVVPFIGGLIVIGAMAFGTGGVVLGIVARRRARSGGAPAQQPAPAAPVASDQPTTQMTTAEPEAPMATAAPGATMASPDTAPPAAPETAPETAPPAPPAPPES